MSASQRRKGNAGEREAAKTLCALADLSPWRQHIQTTRDLVGGNQQQRSGDLLPVSEEAKKLLAPFTMIEVKSVGPWHFSFDQVMRFGAVLPRTTAFACWISRCRASDPQGVELILLKSPRMPLYAIVSCDRWRGTRRTMRFQVQWPTVGEVFGVWTLRELMDVLRSAPA